MNNTPILASLESTLDKPIIISSTGSIASGKSTFLSALHGVLGYNKVGIRIDKDTLRGRSRAKNKREVYERTDKGVLRTNATVRPDSMLVYGTIEGKVYPFQFYAPGGHLHAVKLEESIGGLLYFVDLSLARLCGEPLNTEKMLRLGNQDVRLPVTDGNVFKSIEEIIQDIIRYNTYQPKHTEANRLDGIKKALGVEAEGTDTIEGLAKYLASTSVKDVPMFGLSAETFEGRNSSVRYEGELLGSVMQSVINSHQYAESKSSEGVPVIGVGTHRSAIYKQFPQDREGLLRAVQENFNKAIAKYREYQSQHGIQAEGFTLDLVNGLAIDWHFVELLGSIRVKAEYVEDYDRLVLNINNREVLETAHDIMARALQHQGIEPEGFKIVTFSKKQSGLTTHYA